MGIKQTTIVLSVVGGFAGIAAADIASPPGFGIFSPFENAQAEVIWVGSSAGYTGELRWENPTPSASPTTLWSNHSATVNESFLLPGVFAQGERIDFVYEITRGTYDLFSTSDELDWNQFKIDATNPLDVLVGIEDIRLPSGDGDYNDSVFRVVFSEANVPAPGALALLGGGCLVMGRRRR